MANQNGSSSTKQESSQNAVVERTSVVQRPSNGGLSVLMKTYPPKSTYICTYCDRIFFSYHGLRVHTASHKSGHDELERPLTMNPVSSGLGVSLDPSNAIGGSTNNNNITSVVPPLGGGPTGGISDMTLYHRMSHHLSSGMSIDPSHAIGGSSVVPPISSGTSRGISGMNMTMYDRVVTPHLSSGMSLDPSRTIGGGMSNNNTNTVVPRIGGRITRDISDMNMTMYHQTSPHLSNGRSLDPSRTIGGSRNNNNNNNNTSVIPPISSGTTRGISGMNMTMYHQARPHLSNGMSLHPSHTIGGSSNNITSVVPRISSGTTRDISDTYSSLFEQMRHYVSTGRPLYPSNTIGGSSNNMVPPTSSGATRGISSMNMAMYHHQMNPHHSSGMSLYPSHIVGGSNNNNNNNITSMVPPFRSGTNRNIPGTTMDMYHNHHQANPHISSGESLYPSHTIGSGGGGNNNNNNFTSMVPPFRRETNGGIPGMTRAMYHHSDQVNRINSLSRDENANQNMNVTKNLFDNNHSPHDNHLDLTLGPSKPKEDPGNNNNNNNVIRKEVHVDKEVAKIWGRDLSLFL